MATSAERYCNEEPNSKIMKPFLSIKPGATFFLGSSQTLVYHKDSIEIIYRYQSGKKNFYTHVYMYIVDDTKVTLYADWGDYFLHLDSITQIDHFDGIMKRPCPTFVEILTNNDFEKAGIMSMNGKETMGIGMDVKVDWNGKIKPAALPYHPSVADGIIKITEKSLKLYTEISKNCPLKLWKDRLVAVWGEETK